MSRTSIMTTGILMILIGVQLNVVDTFVMTPQFTQFWKERTTTSLYTTSDDVFSGLTSEYDRTPTSPFRASSSQYPYNASRYSVNDRLNYNYGTPAIRASYSRNVLPNTSGVVAGWGGPQKLFTPPTWICWPSIFMGAVIFLYGAAMDRR